MDSTTVNSFIIGCIVLLVGLTGFLGKNWFTDQKKTTEKLANAIDRLTEFIDRVEKVQDEHGFRLGQIEKDMTAMAQKGYGRRAQDVCDLDACPFREERYHVITPSKDEITLSGSAAKEIKELVRLAQEHKLKGGD